MGLVKGYEFIIRNSKGQIYNFYLNEKNQIEYIVTNENNQWAKKNIVFNEAIYSYSVEIDLLDKIHIVAYSKTEKIYYTLLKNKEWNHHKLLDYSNKGYLVYYPIVKLFNNQVHIFYYLHSKKEKSKCSLHHLTIKDDKWVNVHILDVTYDKLINPFKIIDYKKQLYVLFTSLHNEYSQIFLSNYDGISSHWNKPIRLTDSSIEKLYLDCLLEETGDLHITWSSYDETGLTVQHIKHALGYKTEITQPLSISHKSNCSFPVILQCGDILWSVWLQMNKLFSCYSIDYGITWSTPVLCKESQNINFKRYRFKTNHPKDKQDMVCDYLYGTLYPKIQFIGFGGDMNDEISKNKS
ncbi:MAG: hypothetical protein JJT76_13835 [Clostridiaceae bacterium]|nr:hypothetical protein [Clostridiaceae bacterium]